VKAQGHRGPPKRFFLDSVGCRLNQSEIEAIAANLRGAGHELVDSPDRGDFAILNTCTVTSDADSESRRRSRRIADANPNIRTILTGCWATLNPRVAAALPRVERVVPNGRKEALAHEFAAAEVAEYNLEPVERRPVPGLRMRTRAFIKAQDGCDHHCTYCLTTVARGSSRSLQPSEVLQRVRSAVAGGAQEVVISGVQLSGYGRDLEPRRSLKSLLGILLGGTDIPRLRVSSLEPWGLPPDFFSLWQDTRLCRHLHLPLQSGCDRTLKRMARPMTRTEYARLVERARGQIPDLALTTDVIVGFPGETEAEFQESLAFIESIHFADAHVFRYSLRPDTPATRIASHVPSPTSRARAAAVHDVIERSRKAYRDRFVGQTLQVLWERATKLRSSGWELSGLSDNYLRIRADSPQKKWNRLASVRITSFEDDVLRGTILGA
jgi:threonylcarbamoyladenosine tRNA methylthiotransferase MtaB